MLLVFLNKEKINLKLIEFLIDIYLKYKLRFYD